MRSMSQTPLPQLLLMLPPRWPPASWLALPCRSSQNIFDRFTTDEIGIIPLKFEHAAWCNACEGMTSSCSCPHGPKEKVFLSGTKVRELLQAGQRPPEEFTRPEVADVLVKWATAQVPVAG